MTNAVTVSKRHNTSRKVIVPGHNCPSRAARQRSIIVAVLIVIQATPPILMNGRG